MIKERIHNFWNYSINSKQIYFLAFVIYFVCNFIQDTTLSEAVNGHLLRLFSYLVLPLLFFKIFLLDNWNKRDLIIIILITILGLITWRKAHDVQLLFIVPFVIGAKNVNFRDIVKWYLYLNIFLIISMAIFSLLDIIPNLVYRAAPRPPRYSLGLIYTSSIATHYFYLVLAYCYLRFKDLKWFDYLIIITGNVVCMWITNTKLDFIATFLIIPVMIIAQRAYKGNKYSRIFASFWWIAVPFTAVLIIFTSYFYESSNHIMEKINSITSGRLTLGHKALTQYNIKMFGQTIVEHTYGGSKGLKLANQMNGVNHYFFIDSSYVRMLVLWGSLVFLLVIICMTYIALRSTFDKVFVLSGIILIASLNFMFEPDIIKIFYNPFLLALFATPGFYKVQEDKINESKRN